MAGRRLAWASRDDATGWLRFWLGQHAAMNELFWLLRRGTTPVAGPRRSAEDALVSLASRLVSGDLVVMEESVRLMTPARLSPAPATSSAAALSSLPPLASAPVIASPASLLPAVMEAQIEGALVRPEIEAGLAQLAVSVDPLDQAGTSLKPAPSKVADIAAAMQSASSQATGDLEAL